MASADIIRTLFAFECFSLTLGGERVNQVKVLKTKNGYFVFSS